MAIKFEFNGKQMGAKFKQAIESKYGVIADASRDAATQAAYEIKTKGDVDIQAGGNFGKRWTDSFSVVVNPSRGRTVNIIIQAFSSIPYFMIHERGGTIHGKPLLWIPLSWTGIKIRAREYGQRYGLFRVDRKRGGNPLLLSIRDGEPKYVGVESVRLKKRFHIGRIIRETARKMPAYYKAAFNRRK